MKTWIDRVVPRGAEWAGLYELTRTQRGLMAAGGLAMSGLLVALALTCQASVLRGERLRAEQRAGVSVSMDMTDDLAGVGREQGLARRATTSR